VKKLLYAIICLVSLCSCVGPVTKKPVDAKPEVIESITRYRKEYILAPGDQLAVAVYRHPDLSVEGMIRTDGYVSLMMLDDVKAAGLTVQEFKKRVSDLYSKRILNPELSVALRNVRPAMVYVMGEVGRPGPVPVRDAATAAQAVAYAGGMTHSAARNSIALVRLNDDGRISAYKICEDGQDGHEGQPYYYMAMQNTLLQADDIIIVPEGYQTQFQRFVSDWINTPLNGLNSILNPYFQFKIINNLK